MPTAIKQDSSTWVEATTTNPLPAIKWSSTIDANVIEGKSFDIKAITNGWTIHKREASHYQFKHGHSRDADFWTLRRFETDVADFATAAVAQSFVEAYYRSKLFGKVDGIYE